MSKFLKSAIWYRRKGFSVIPCKPQSKEALILWEEYQKRLPTEEEVKRWWTQNPDANIGIVLGNISNLIALEIDDQKALEGKEIPITPQAISGGKGLPHIFFYYPKEGMKNYKAHENGREIFSIRGDGQYIIAPPSIHPLGNLYKWAYKLGIHEVEPAPPPDWIVDLIVNNPAKEEAKRHYKQQDNKYNDNLRQYVQRLKGKIQLSKLLVHEGVEKTEEHSRYSQFNCPYHESEGKKSLTVWDDIGVAKDWHDEKPYDAIEFICKYKKIGFKEALNYLADYAEIERYQTNLSAEEKESQRQSQADRLVALVEKLNPTLFHDAYKEPYARLRIGSHFEIHKIRSKSFKRWLSQQFWELKGKVPNSDSLNSALAVIEAKACFEGENYKLHNRVAWHDNSIWYDLGNWKAVKITKDGWEVVDEPPILFKRYAHQKAQVIPEACSEKHLFQIFNFVNISKKELRLLFIANLACGLIPDIPHPIDVLHGDQGTAKTTVSRIKKELLDPSEMKTLTHPNNKTEFVQLASHHWYIVLDNLSGLPEWLSDALCRACTGDGFSKRELYTDDEDIIYSFLRCVCLTGINLVPTKPDLLDRSLIFELDTIPDNVRKEEILFWKEFYEEKPKLLGALLTLLSKAMKEYENVEIKKKPRMADFATWGCGVARALSKSETDFLNAYLKNIETQNEEAIEASPIAKATIEFMKDQDEWEGAPSELLEQIDLVAEKLKLDTKDKRYPKDPRWLWRRIKDVRTNLRAVGILADKKGDSSHSDRNITLKRTYQQGKKNGAHDDITPKSEQSREDTLGDTTGDTKNDAHDDAHCNPSESLENRRQGNTGDISETLLENEEKELDPWDKVEP